MGERRTWSVSVCCIVAAVRSAAAAGRGGRGNGNGGGDGGGGDANVMNGAVVYVSPWSFALGRMNNKLLI